MGWGAKSHVAMNLEGEGAQQKSFCSEGGEGKSLCNEFGVEGCWGSPKNHVALNGGGAGGGTRKDHFAMNEIRCKYF